MGLLGVGAVCGIVCGMTQKNGTKGRHKASPQRDDTSQNTKGRHKTRTQRGYTKTGHKVATLIQDTKGLHRQDTKG